MEQPRPHAVPGPSTPGWSTLHRTVRETDVNKVDDCREDIDTLLVFAGLYSAVLTAFVIESYTHLQEDPQDVIIELLQHIAKQNYISGPGFINSTTLPPSPPPFEPPLWAVRVNVLWFTSLLLSLSSASFGIIVKQWLREYLAIEHTHPRQRLRARQYRYAALSEWKVFEIAAFLPLLLQLSLGLFFVGLCFFTAAVHNSIGYTTTPLVSAWAFFLFATIIAPLFSPRCPFKMTFLKRPMKSGRRYVFLFTCCITALGSLLLPSLTAGIRIAALPCLAACQPIRKAFSRGLAYACGVAPAATIGADDEGTTLYVRLYVRVWTWIRHISSPWVRYPISGVWMTLCFPVQLWGRVKVKMREMGPDAGEEDAVRAEGRDIEMLLSIDSLMSDDGLLPSMINVVQQQAGTDPAKLVEFIWRMVNQRNGRYLPDGGTSRVMPRLPDLSGFALSTIKESLVNTLRPDSLSVVDERGHSPSWVFHAMFMLLANPHFDLPELAVCGDVMIVSPRTTPSQHLCPSGVPLHRCFPRIAPTGADDDPGVSNTTACLLRVLDVYKMLLCSETKCTSPTLRHLLDSHAVSDEFSRVSVRVMHALCTAIFSFMSPGGSAVQEDLAETCGAHEALYVVVQYGFRFGMLEGAVRLCRQLLSTEPGARMVLAQMAPLHPQCLASGYSNIVLWGSMQFQSHEDTRRMQPQLVAACERFCAEGHGDVPLDYVRLCAVCFLWMGRGAQRALAKAIERYHQTQGWHGELRCRDYWYSDAKSPTPAELFKEDQDMACRMLRMSWRMISFEVMDALWLFVPEERREEILRTMRTKIPNYTPRMRNDVGEEMEDCVYGMQADVEAGRVQAAGDVMREEFGGVSQEVGEGEDMDSPGGLWLSV